MSETRRFIVSHVLQYYQNSSSENLSDFFVSFFITGFYKRKVPLLPTNLIVLVRIWSFHLTTYAGG